MKIYNLLRSVETDSETVDEIESFISLEEAREALKQNYLEDSIIGYFQDLLDNGCYLKKDKAQLVIRDYEDSEGEMYVISYKILESEL